jgi:ankyrin repeat protein
MSSPASLPKEIHRSAERGELQKVVKWLRKGGLVDAHCSATTRDGRPATTTLLLTATANDHLAMVRELLKRGASVDLQASLRNTALMNAAFYGRLSTVLVLLQHSANPDLQNNIDGFTALMAVAHQGHEACVKALLRAKANPELLDEDGRIALQHAEAKGHTALAALLRQHAAPPQPAAAAPAAPRDAGEPAESSPASLPLEIFQSAEQGELQKVVKWLRKGGLADAFCSATTLDGQPTATTLLQTAAACDHLVLMVREC